VPWLWYELWVEESIHGNSLVSQDRGHRCCTKYPGQRVPVASEPPAYTAILARSNGSPVIDCSCG
jgi:hypothetical protein